jgi:hypothetical protein
MKKPGKLGIQENFYKEGRKAGSLVFIFLFLIPKT